MIRNALQDTKAVDAYMTVAKRIVLFLARAAPQQSIDHLVTEAARQLHEEGNAPPPAGAGGDSPRSQVRALGICYPELL